MNKIYKHRAVFVFFAFCLLYSIILFNLYLIQINQGEFFLNLGKKQYNITISRYPARADILDRTGKQALAINKDFLSAFILPKQLNEPEKVEQFLKINFPSAFSRFNLNREKSFMFVKRRLNKEQLDLIDKENLKDIKLLKERGRFYPVTCAGPVVGATDVDNKGLFGMELQYNSQLSGKPAIFSLEQEARSGHFYFKKEEKKQGINGKPLRLTIDSDLQFLAHEELESCIKQWDAKEGTAIVMDPSNGDILAMVSSPAFNPNDLGNIDLEKTKNKVVTESYEFGSIAKIFAGLAALQEGVTNIDEQIDCKNCKTAYIDGRKVNTLVAHGILSFSEVIELSNNIGIAQVAKRLGQKLFDHYTKIGFGEKTGINFPGEQSGFVNPPSNWSKQSIISLSYGYEMTCTLLQIAQAFCMIARDGYPIKPRLVLPKESKKQNLDFKPLYAKETIELVKQILENTTMRGTAKRAGIKGYKIMSKTGTANLLVNGKYFPDKNIYTCAGIVQKGSYQRVIVTFVKEATKNNAYAATVAAPLFEKIATKVLIHDKVV